MYNLEANNKLMEHKLIEHYNKFEDILSFRMKIKTLEIEIKNLEELSSNLRNFIHDLEMKRQ